MLKNLRRQNNDDEALGKYTIIRTTFLRRLVVQGLDAVPPGHNIMGLLEFDITDSRKALRELRREGKRVSLLAFVIKSIAMALNEYKELNSILNGREIFEFSDIDINLPIETNSKEGKFPHQIVIRKAAEKSVEEISREIGEAKKKYEASGDAGQEDKWAMGLMKKLFLLPRFIRKLILRKLISNPYNVKRMSGTVFITSINMLASGFAIPYLGGPRAVSFALGGVVRKPAVIGEDILPREILSMTVVFNHDIVDGAPAARFVQRLKTIVEKGSVL